MNSSDLSSPRLLLRRWRQGDLDSFAAINADPRVMEHFPAALDRAQSAALIGRIEEHFDRYGFGLWAVEREGRLLGFTGLAVPRFAARFTPAVEVGWRLAYEAWGKGYAREAATRVLDEAFGPLGLLEVVAFTTTANARSRRLIEALGMSRDPAEDFDHPLVADPRFRRHVLYRLSAGRWRAARGGSGEQPRR